MNYTFKTFHFIIPLKINTFGFFVIKIRNTNRVKYILTIDNLTVRHLEKTLFQSLSLQIREGQQWAILGNSGAGKTALLHTLFGDFNIINGHIRYPFFKEFKHTHGITDPLFTNRQLMALVSQQAQFKNKQNMKDFFYQQRFHSWFAEEAHTVEDYLNEEFEKIIVNIRGKTIRFSKQWVIQHLQLKHLLQKTLIQLSNGETRRLLIAHALLKQPLLLLLDNPFIGLDTDTRPILIRLLQKITQKGTHLIMATTTREIPDCITHILLLEKGKIKFAGPKHAFNKQTVTERIRSKWQPDKELLSKIAQLQPDQEDPFNDALKMENICVRYGKKDILKDVNWTVKKGEKWALSGPNGAGKSTLLSLLNGDHPQAYANRIKLFDQKRGSGESIWELKHRIGFVSPEMHQYFRGNGTSIRVILSGLDDTMGFRRKETSKQERELALYWLKLLDLSPLEEVSFKDVANGEQRLLLLLRAMIKNPPLLLLDEPCQGLDEVQKEHFKSIIDVLCSKKDKTLIYVSHYKEDIPDCVNKVLELENGKVKKR